MYRTINKGVFIIILCSINIMANGGIPIVVSINDFGAIPNDNKDDSIAIEKALKVSGSITMEKGTYNVYGVTRINKTTIIDGNNSTFIGKLDITNKGRTSKNILTLKGDKIIIKNLLLDGAYTNGNAKEQINVSSLLHIYDSENILLDGVSTINHASNWWSSKSFNFSQLNNNHQMDMHHVIYIAFSDNVKIRNMEQKANIKTEGLLVYESDNINIEGFKSFNSPKIWTSLHVVASDNIIMKNIEVGDGSINAKGSSINFIANHHFLIQNAKTTTKQGFDISNEIRIQGLKGRIIRDTSHGIFKNCHFEGQRGLYGYPSINKNEDLLFQNTKFIPTKEGTETWGARIQYGGSITFNNCIFGSEKFKTFGIIMGDSKEVNIINCKFINPSVGLYVFGKTFGKINIQNNFFEGNNYTPIDFYWKTNQERGIVNQFNCFKNKVKGKLRSKFFNIRGNIKINKILLN